MKPYRKPIIAVDSDRLIVIDDNVKELSLSVLFLKLAGFVTLFGLTCYGLIGGVTSKVAQEKLDSLDAWADSPANKELLFYTGIGLLSVILGSVVLYWAYKRWVK